jgi:hypothetical protein
LSNESTENLSKELKALKSFLSVEIRTKTEASKGEIIFSVDPMNDRGENDHPFSPVDVKAILLRNGLQPIDFRQIK